MVVRIEGAYGIVACGRVSFLEFYGETKAAQERHEATFREEQRKREALKRAGDAAR